MSRRPEFYSGRGATTSDLNSNTLFNIHDAIEKEYGKSAAKNFVNMIDDIKVLSATTFLTELYDLYHANWKYKKKRQSAPGVSVPKDKDGNDNVALGVFGVMESMFASERDQTAEIKNWFLYRKLTSKRKSKQNRTITCSWYDHH